MPVHETASDDPAHGIAEECEWKTFGFAILEVPDVLGEAVDPLEKRLVRLKLERSRIESASRKARQRRTSVCDRTQIMRLFMPAGDKENSCA